MDIEEIKIEEDFDENFYEKQLPEVTAYYHGSGYTKRQRYYHHYLNYGQGLYKNLKECEEKLLGNTDIDKNFDENLHEKIHPDVVNYLPNLIDMLGKRKIYYHHYINYSKNKIPNDFNPTIYKLLNEDLNGLTNEQAIKHYMFYGIFEKRHYRFNFELDKNFDPRLYKIHNSDLTFMSDSQANVHYLVHGKKEGRIFYTGMSYSELMKESKKANDNKYKNCVVLINHDVSLTGAPIFLYDLYDFFIENNYFSQVVIIEACPNNILPNANKLYHFNDYKKLLSIIEDLNPTLIYSNSLNLLLRNLSSFKYWLSRTVFHLHETYDPFNNYVEKDFDLTNLTIKLASEKIKKEYLSKQSFSNITIFPPFITEKKLKKIETSSKEKCEIAIEQKVDCNKIIIGMSGSLCDRKNLILFHQLAEKCPDYEFLWIGGKNLDEYFEKNNIKVKSKNFYWVPDTKNPYKYFEQIDYFFLTSLSDPCPIVVLENLYLNKKIIVLKNNIHTNHNTKLLENYIEIDNSDTDTNLDIINKFKNLKLDKNKNTTNKNRNYIEKEYSKPLISNKSKCENFFICSIYVDNLDIDLNYLINLINQFNIRNKFSYKTIVSLSFSKELYSNIGNFDCKPIAYLSKYLINLNNIIFRKNIGYDIGGLIDGIKYIYENFEVKENSRLAYTHSKSNQYWRSVNDEIFYVDDNTSDTIVAEKFSVFCNHKDLNFNIIKSYPDIFNLSKSEFQYIQGTVFRTNLNFLKELNCKYEKIASRLTDVYKNDEYWISIMKDKNVFENYFSQYSNNIFNKPIDKESHYIVSTGLAKNYIELLEKHGIRGIPDCQFEHALERYIGYLIFDNKKVLKI